MFQTTNQLSVFGQLCNLLSSHLNYPVPIKSRRPDLRRHVVTVVHRWSHGVDKNMAGNTLPNRKTNLHVANTKRYQKK